MHNLKDVEMALLKSTENDVQSYSRMPAKKGWWHVKMQVFPTFLSSTLYTLLLLLLLGVSYAAVK